MKNKRMMMLVVVVLALAAGACVCTGALEDLVDSSGGSSGGGGGSSSDFDGGDGLTTVQQGSISIGSQGSSDLDDLFTADNWTFEGTAGQTVTIAVDAVGETDPRVKVIDPSGNVVGEDDDGGGGFSSSLTVTLPVSGTYTIRVDVFSAGTYNLSVR